jgi:hypothetical protein
MKSGLVAGVFCIVAGTSPASDFKKKNSGYYAVSLLGGLMSESRSIFFY